MSGPIHDLYQNQTYPPMSHPLSDPAVSAVAARLAGLETTHPRRARILEIGCCSGHNLMPLAMRWPESRSVGIDLAQNSIEEAKERARLAGITNVEFHATDLMDFDPTVPFDFIIAHGFFSWVPDEIKGRLLEFCRKHLTESGIATISFNLESGWKPRLPVIAKAQAIFQAGAKDIVSALAILRTVTEPGDPEQAIIDDMLAKGPNILPFDDFGPINDPWPLGRFIQAAGNAGLKWLGESDPGENISSSVDEKTLASLKAQAATPLAFQTAVDDATGRTFRSGILCRHDAPVENRDPLDRIPEFYFRAGSKPDNPAFSDIFEAVRSFEPTCVPWAEVMPKLATNDPAILHRHILAGIGRGWLRPRIEPVSYSPDPPAFPQLDPLRLLCARESLPLVDAWHKPCAFPLPHYRILAAMDGSLSTTELETLAKALCPDLAFTPWLRHLAWRGMFA